MPQKWKDVTVDVDYEQDDSAETEPYRALLKTQAELSLRHQKWVSLVVAVLAALLLAVVIAIAIVVMSHTAICEDFTAEDKAIIAQSIHPSGQTPNTWLNKTSWQAPHGRLAHAAASVSERYVYIFGGTYGTAAPTIIPYVSYADLWRYDLDTYTWTEVTQRGDVPPARLHASMVASSDDTLLLFGGFNVFQGQPGHTGLNDLYEFRISTGVWTRLDTLISGPAPTIRGAHGAEWLNGAMWVYGGFPQISTTGHLRELWKLTLYPASWTSITMPVVASSPEGRIGFAMSALDADTILLTGGACSTLVDSDGQCDTLWTYTTSTDTWTSRSTAGGAEDPFQRRASDAAATIGGVIFQTGGIYLGPPAPKMFNDLFALDTTTWQWLPIVPNYGRGSKPNPTFGHSFVSAGDRILFFGGREGAPTHPGSAQTWVYRSVLPSL